MAQIICGGKGKEGYPIVRRGTDGTRHNKAHGGRKLEHTAILKYNEQIIYKGHTWQQHQRFGERLLEGRATRVRATPIPRRQPTTSQARLDRILKPALIHAACTVTHKAAPLPRPWLPNGRPNTLQQQHPEPHMTNPDTEFFSLPEARGSGLLV